MKPFKSQTIFLLTVLFLCFLSVSNAQVIDAEVTLTTQAEVNLFVGTSITGDLTINGPDIFNLTPLSTLTSVGGDLYVGYNDILTNLDGLDNITSIGGYLYVGYNAVLTNLDGLSNITSVSSYLMVVNNDAIINLDGLSNITSLASDLFIGHNDSLTNIDGMSSITSVTGNLFLVYNATLTNLNGLGNITSVSGYLEVGNNDALTNLDGLGNITSIDGYLYVGYNAVLTNLDGLSNLSYVGGYLGIAHNTSLNSFCGLYMLLSSNGLGGDYNVSDNLLNLTQQQIINNGPCITSISSENEAKSKYYKLQQNYPNPFNPETTISFEVKESTSVKLKIYNISGKLISTLLDKRMLPGSYKVPFRASDISSGIYFYHIQMGNYQSVKKMILLQ